MASPQPTMLEQILRSTFQQRPERGGEGALRLMESRRKNSEEKSCFRDGGYWLTTLFSLRGRAFPLTPLLVYLVYSSAVVAIVLYAIPDPTSNVHLSQMTNVQATLGSLLGLLLAFRFNHGYNRWMDGRKTWEIVHNSCCNLARYAQVYVEEKAKAQKLIAYGSMFPRALKLHLHESTDLQGYCELSAAEVQEIASSHHMPLCILGKMSALVKEMKISDSMKLCLLEKHIEQLSDAVGTTNTISSAPAPFAYIAHLRSIMIGFLLLFPFIFAPSLQWYCLVVCAFSGFAWLGVETVTLEIESPFGVDYNDLPLNSYNTEIHNCISVWPDVAPAYCSKKAVLIDIQNTQDSKEGKGGNTGTKAPQLCHSANSIPRNRFRNGNNGVGVEGSNGGYGTTDSSAKVVSIADSAYSSFVEFKESMRNADVDTEEGARDVCVAIDSLDARRRNEQDASAAAPAAPTAAGSTFM